MVVTNPSELGRSTLAERCRSTPGRAGALVVVGDAEVIGLLDFDEAVG